MKYEIDHFKKIHKEYHAMIKSTSISIAAIGLCIILALLFAWHVKSIVFKCIFLASFMGLVWHLMQGIELVRNMKHERRRVKEVIDRLNEQQ